MVSMPFILTNNQHNSNTSLVYFNRLQKRLNVVFLSFGLEIWVLLYNVSTTYNFYKAKHYSYYTDEYSALLSTHWL